jgi:hypothetical protein
MLQQLISLNPDLKQLWDDGYDLEYSGGYLLTHHIPYVTPDKQVKLGTLVCVLTLASPTRLASPGDHTIFFTGETPCNSDGSALVAIINNSNRQQLTPSILVDHYFSSKPLSGRYNNYYEKIRTYAEILCSQAKVIDSTVTTKPNKNKAA